MKLRDARRGESRESITVGEVKVEAGGQAIVGKVEINDRVKNHRRRDPATIRSPRIEPIRLTFTRLATRWLAPINVTPVRCSPAPAVEQGHEAPAAARRR